MLLEKLKAPVVSGANMHPSALHRAINRRPETSLDLDLVIRLQHRLHIRIYTYLQIFAQDFVKQRLLTLCIVLSQAHCIMWGGSYFTNHAILILLFLIYN